MFDLLVLDGENLMKRPLSSRYGVRISPVAPGLLADNKAHSQRLHAFVYEPFRKMVKENPEIQQQLPFEYVATNEYWCSVAS